MKTEKRSCSGFQKSQWYSSLSSAENLIQPFGWVGFFVVCMTAHKSCDKTLPMQPTTAPSFAPSASFANACLEQLPLAILLVDATGHLAYANPAAENALGSSARMLAGQPATQFFLWPEDFHAQWKTLHHTPALTREIPCDIRSRIGKIEPVMVQTAPLELTDGRVLLALYFTPASTLPPAAADADTRTASLANILAHEIKNPLTGIRGAAQLLAKFVPEHAQKFSTMIIQEVERIRALVDDMVAFSERSASSFSAINMHEVLRHSSMVVQNNQHTSVEWKEVFDPSLPEVRGQQDRLIQLVLNLLLNAQEALKDTPNPSITLRSFYRPAPRLTHAAEGGEPPSLIFQIEDNGPGILPDIQAKILEPFVSTKPGSRGLGLAVAAKIAAEHHGVLRLIESRQGHTLFEICLPRWK